MPVEVCTKVGLVPLVVTDSLSLSRIVEPCNGNGTPSHMRVNLLALICSMADLATLFSDQ